MDIECSTDDIPPEIIYVKDDGDIIDDAAEKQPKSDDNNTELLAIITPVIATSKTSEINESHVLMTDALRGIAAAYTDSSDDEDEVSIVKEQISVLDPLKKSDYRCKESDSETDTEDDSTSSSSDSSSQPENQANTDSDNDNDNEDSSKPKKRGEKKKSEKGEYDGLPPIEDLNISVPEVLCDPVGEVGWMVQQMVVVTPKPLKPTLNIDTVLFVERGRRVLGRIFDVFGPVSEPHYCVRFNDSEHIKENNITVGMIVYYCPNTPYTTLVFMTDLLKMKASDDVGDDEHPAFSDDEEERAYYSSLKQKQANNKGSENDKNTEIPKKRLCSSGNNNGWKSKHPWNNERRPQQQQQNQPQRHQHHHYNSCYYNDMQQQNFWQYPQAPYNQWLLNPEFHNWPRPLSNVESTSHYSSSFQSNVDFPQQQRPSFMWPNNGSTFTPTQIQSAPWRAPAPPSLFSSSHSPPPPPPGI